MLRHIILAGATLLYSPSCGLGIVGASSRPGEHESVLSQQAPQTDQIDVQAMNLYFSRQPSDGNVAVRLVQQPVVEITDAAGAVLAPGAPQPWVAFSLDPDAGGLIGDLVVRAVAGQVSPTDLAATAAGDYRLRAVVLGHSSAFVPGGEAFSRLVTIHP